MFLFIDLLYFTAFRCRQLHVFLIDDRVEASSRLGLDRLATAITIDVSVEAKILFDP